ncbi:hypothetical protein CPter291_2396 [Collimonas pratensis]|uniref:Uncharacterized protein n=1 Tax=Collimonas pratensis TaxID=279113 RepID=A0ABM5Z725_9BURK|nr:hypothetical protein CPter291_2396 [Collimonas pratensis]
MIERILQHHSNLYSQALKKIKFPAIFLSCRTCRQTHGPR